MSRFPILDDFEEKAKSTLWSNQMLVKIDEETQRDAKIKNNPLQTLQVMQDGCNERDELMVELRQLNFKLAPYKSLEVLKELQWKDAINMMELRKFIINLQLSIHKKWDFVEVIRGMDMFSINVNVMFMFLKSVQSILH
ncbi:hypothetical protein Tco_1566440, partial [Tanacetum coccineum]